jgi:hypothetical protein
MTDERKNRDVLDPGAYIGNEPEREAESIPGGVKPGDERVAAHDSKPGLQEEPSDESVVDRDPTDDVEALIEPTLE